MAAIQDNLMLIGLAFAVLLVAFFIVAFFTRANLTDGQLQILRFLASLCAGFSAALIVGDLVANGTVPLPANQSLTISASAGFALFLIIWFTFDRTVTPPDSYNISIPEGLAFEPAAKAIAAQDGAVANLEGFAQEEKQAALSGQQLRCKSPEEAMSLLRNLAKTEIRPYEVSRDGAMITLRIKNL